VKSKIFAPPWSLPALMATERGRAVNGGALVPPSARLSAAPAGAAPLEMTEITY